MNFGVRICELFYFTDMHHILNYGSSMIIFQYMKLIFKLVF